MVDSVRAVPGKMGLPEADLVVAENMVMAEAAEVGLGEEVALVAVRMEGVEVMVVVVGGKDGEVVMDVVALGEELVRGEVMTVVGAVEATVAKASVVSLEEVVV